MGQKRYLVVKEENIKKKQGRPKKSLVGEDE